MEKINLSEPNGTGDAWRALAAREGGRLGRLVTLSEYIRRAVEAYSPPELEAGTYKIDPANSTTSGGIPARVPADDLTEAAHESGAIPSDHHIVILKVDPARPTPFPKSAQLGKKR